MREVVVIRGSRKRNRVLCAKCSEAAALVTIEEAVKISGITARAIYRLIEAGEVHFVETAEGLTLICAATLLARVGKNRTAN